MGKAVSESARRARVRCAADYAGLSVSARENACLTFIEAFNALEHRGPSYREIGIALHLTGDTGAVRIVQSLIGRRFIERTRGGLALRQHSEIPYPY